MFDKEKADIKSYKIRFHRSKLYKNIKSKSKSECKKKETSISYENI